MTRRATSLGPKPSLYGFVLFFSFSFLFFFGGFKGQVRWPEGPPHLALNPPYLFFFVWFFVSCVFFLVFNQKPCFFPLKRALFCFFLSVSLGPCLSPWPFLASPFSTFFFSASLFLSSFFLPSCLSFLLSFGSSFLSLAFFLFLLCFCFMKRATSKY